MDNPYCSCKLTRVRSRQTHVEPASYESHTYVLAQFWTKDTSHLNTSNTSCECLPSNCTAVSYHGQMLTRDYQSCGVIADGCSNTTYKKETRKTPHTHC